MFSKKMSLHPATESVEITSFLMNQEIEISISPYKLPIIRGHRFFITGLNTGHMEIDIPLVDKGTLKILCPTCKSGTLVIESETEVRCTECRATFPVKNKIIDVLPESPRQEHMWGDILEWGPFVRFYESRWWRRGLVNNMYLAIPFDRELEVISRAAHFTNDSIVLDVACGSGIYSRPFARNSENGAVIGLDLSMPMLDYARAKAQSEGIENLLFIHGDAHDLPFLENQFDVVNCCGALHLFCDLHKMLSEVCRVLKPGGHFTSGVGRWPWPGKYGRKFRDWYHRRSGVKGFFREELVSFFEEAGLTNVACLYEKRAWFIMSGVKP